MTTHYLDEAEKLANRIAILNKGQILILGSADFIKNKYGIGYFCTVFFFKNENEDSKKTVLQIFNNYGFN